MNVQSIQIRRKHLQRKPDHIDYLHHQQQHRGIPLRAQDGRSGAERRGREAERVCPGESGGKVGQRGPAD